VNTTSDSTGLAASDGTATSLRADAVRKGRQLELFTIVWNVIEGLVSIGAGAMAGSVALVGFGLDSFIETSSGAVLLWRLRDGERGERRERVALKLVGWAFIALAVYVACEALAKLVTRDEPSASPVGIVITALSLIVMPMLARGKRRVAAAIESRALHADSRQTDLCVWLSAIVLAGLGLNAALGWWWADPVASLVMVPIIAREGVDALRGKHCDACSH